MAQLGTSSSDPVAQSWSRRYPPIAIALVTAFLIALIVLPSALNIPQTNPTTIAEYAPVPPEDDAPPDTAGNVSALGLGTSSSLGKGVPQSIETPAALTGSRVAGKRCVGKPPRQAEDPMSPPCVSFFEGDNGGATYQGVTRDEIIALVLSDSGGRNTGESTENSGPAGSYCDVDLPPNTGGAGCYIQNQTTDHGFIRFVRSFSRYFNSRYQTYGRHVHFWHHWSNVATNSAVKRSEAADNHASLKPLAVLDQTVSTGSDDAYYDAITRRRVMVTAGSALSPPTSAVNYQRRAPLLWGFIPDVEHWMQAFTSYVCTKVAPFPVKHAQGGVSSNGRPMNDQPRRIALVYDNTGGLTNEYRFAAQLLETYLKDQCGVSFVAKVAYSDDTQNGVYLAELRQKDATTLLVVGSTVPLPLFVAADSAAFYPEVVFAGDGTIDRNLSGRLYPDNFMRNAWLMTYLIGSLSLEEDYAFRACTEGDPSQSRAACQLAATKYQDYLLLFKMIQAAGPRLTPRNVDRGMHSLPKISSTSRAEASCFYDPDDYTCIKDAMEEWWDNTGRVPGASSPGCWRMVRGGVRYLPGTWPRQDEVFFNGTKDPCNAYTLGGQVDP